MSPLAPMFSGDALEDFTFHRVVVTVDKYGDQTTTTSDVAARGLFAPAHTVEDESGLSTGVTAPATIYLDQYQRAPGADWTVTARGLLWTVKGDPQVWRGAGIVVELERFGGAPDGTSEAHD